MSKKYSGLTLIEVLIVIAIIAVLIVIIFAYFSPLRERDRAADSERKADLNRIGIALEEYYSDNDCYPDQTSYENNPAILNPYLNNIPHDPDTNEAYYYSPEDTNCPQYFRLYAILFWKSDPVIVEVGCASGCGPAGAYNYGISSPNVALVREAILSDAVGCTGVNQCAICQADENNRCACNAVEYCRPDDGGCPPDVEECYPASLCFFLDSGCGGYAGKSMPY